MDLITKIIIEITKTRKAFQDVISATSYGIKLKQVNIRKKIKTKTEIRIYMKIKKLFK